MPVLLKQEPAPAAAPPVPIADTLDPGETLLSTVVDAAPALNVLTNEAASEGFALVIIALMAFLIFKFILELIPKVILIGVGAAILYAYLK